MGLRVGKNNQNKNPDNKNIFIYRTFLPMA